MDALRAVHGSYSYLSYPPPNSWIWTFAFMFRLLGLLCVVPMLCLALLVSHPLRYSATRIALQESEPTGQDITSYAIVRTLGIPYTHPASSKCVVSMQPEKTSPRMSKESSDSSLSVSELPSKPSEYFTTPGEGASLGLAGFGLWSPPATRPSSPVTSRNPSRLALSNNLAPIAMSRNVEASDDEAKPPLRRRKPGPEIVVTEQ